MESIKCLNLTWSQIKDQVTSNIYGPEPLCPARLETVRKKVIPKINWLANNASNNHVYADALNKLKIIEANQSCRTVVAAAISILNSHDSQTRRRTALQFHHEATQYLDKVAEHYHFI
jgi:hypothetical protein